MADLENKNQLSPAEQERASQILRRDQKSTDAGYGGYIDTNLGYGQQTRREKELSAAAKSAPEIDNLVRQYRAATTDSPAAKQARLLEQEKALRDQPALGGKVKSDNEKFSELGDIDDAEADELDKMDDDGDFDDDDFSPDMAAQQLHREVTYQRISQIESTSETEPEPLQRASSLAERLKHWPPSLAGKIGTLIRLGLYGLGGMFVTKGLDSAIGEDATDNVLVALGCLGIIIGLALAAIPMIYMFMMIGGAINTLKSFF